MLKANSLFYTVVISIILAIITASLILFAYYSRIEFQSYEIIRKLNLNAESGINLLLSRQEIIAAGEEKTIDLFKNGDDSVHIKRNNWGAFEIALAKATSGKKEVSRIALTGYPCTAKESYSLYLADHDQPLAVCGATLIRGTAYLPKAGIKRAYIEGQNFTGNNLVEGIIRQSNKQIPEFNKSIITNMKQLLEGTALSENDSVLELENRLPFDSLTNSFADKTIMLVSKAALKLRNIYYSGNIILVSTKKITISASCQLQNILVLAPKIFIEKDFKGQVQLFASDSLILQKNVRLDYPSVAGLFSNNNSSKFSVIQLDENDSVSGAVFACQQKQDIAKVSGVLIAQKSFVQGQIYSDGYADIRGTVYGSVMCNTIMLNTTSSVYQNHLLNAVIDLTKRSKYYAGSALTEEAGFKTIVKWLN